MKVLKAIFTIIICGTLYSTAANAQKTTPSQTGGVVTVGGEVGNPYTISETSFSEMKQVTLKAIGHDNKEHEYTGVLLNDIISKAAALPENKLSGKGLAKYVLIKAADGYRALIAIAEIHPDFTDKTIILANKQDGKLLSSGVGPYQVIIPGEKKHGRWVRQVTAIEVLTAKE